MVQHSSQFPQLVDLDPILTDIFYQHYEYATGGPDVGTMANRISANGVLNLFNQQMSSKAKETDFRIGSFRDPVVFDGKVEYQRLERGYEVEYVPDAYVSGFQVEREMYDDNQYDFVFSSANEMGTAFGRRTRKDAASVFNNAFAAGTTGYDAVPLCSASHPRSRTDATTVSNTLTTALTSDSLETAITTMQGFDDDNGEYIVILPDTLVVPIALRKTALEIAGSEYTPENANMTRNVYDGAMQVIVDPYLTSTTAWFVVDSTMSRKYLKWYNRVMPEFGSTEDFDSFIYKYRGYQRYSFGWSDFRWIIGSTGTG